MQQYTEEQLKQLDIETKLAVKKACETTFLLNMIKLVVIIALPILIILFLLTFGGKYLISLL